MGFYDGTKRVYRGNLNTHTISYIPGKHISDQYAAFADSLCAIFGKETFLSVRAATWPPGNIYKIPGTMSGGQVAAPTDRSAKPIDFGNNPIVCVHPGGGDLPLREWPIDNFIVLIEKIMQHTEWQVLLVGTNESAKRARAIVAQIHSPRCIDYTGKTTIAELCTIFERAHALITADSGIAHIASVTKIRQYVLFGPETPNLFRPLGTKTTIFFKQLPCSPCFSLLNHRTSSCRTNRCLQTITPQEVYATLERDIIATT